MKYAKEMEVASRLGTLIDAQFHNHENLALGHDPAFKSLRLDEAMEAGTNREWESGYLAALRFIRDDIIPSLIEGYARMED
jgi:hypothetical protein